MAKEERIYNVPLRKGFQKAPRYRRAKKAVAVLKTFLLKHMKSTDVRLGPVLNRKIWERGIKNPPHHVKVTVYKDEDVAKAELFGHKYPEVKEDTKKGKKDLEKAVETKITKEKTEKKPKEEKTEKKEIDKKETKKVKIQKTHETKKVSGSQKSKKSKETKTPEKEVKKKATKKSSTIIKPSKK